MIVIKIGGGKEINLNSISLDVSTLKDKLIIVHGGNYYLDKYSRDLGIEKKMLNLPSGLQSRYTTEATIDLMYMTYAGLANKKIVSGLIKHNINAIGLSGIDGKLIIGKRHPALISQEGDKKIVVKDDLTGSIESVNLELLNSLLESGLTPVITPPVITPDGEVINVDGDKIAAKIAIELKAKTLIFLIEAAGIMTDLDDPGSLIKEVTRANLEQLLAVVKGRMKRKLMECIKLIDLGIERIIISDGRVESPISSALGGAGTQIS
ncbi:MAG TPA: [LysW]-aminoadipate kinase [Candidatus Saccharimonadales bacterium]|nr:[LysW]-aminoadipate kinase [Candidatus Saccharimonadales bacterium]